MAMFRNVFGGCVSDRSTEAMRRQKLKFGVPLHIALKNGYIPVSLVELLVYIAHEGMFTADLFRRPGNPGDTRRIVKRLSEGKPVIFQNYNLYTLASVVKKFLLRLPGGIFGPEGEHTLLHVLAIGHKMEQYEAVHKFISSLKVSHQHLISLLYGIWFTMINNCDINFMTVEALSRSVAGSMFHTCATNPARVEKASRIMQLLIENFGVAGMFGQENIEYFAEITSTEMHIREKFKCQFVYSPPEDSFSTILEDGFNEMSQMHSSREHVHEQDDDVKMSESGSPEMVRYIGMKSMARLHAVSTISAPEVSLVPSPGLINKRPKSFEDNLNETAEIQSSRPSISRFNSVKRKQLERLRHRSDWFLGPNSCTTLEQSQQQELISVGNEHQVLQAKSSGNSVTKASSEGTGLDLHSDNDSVFSESSRSESPASEPARSQSVRIIRDIIHSDTLEDVQMSETGEIRNEDMAVGDSDICYFVVEHKYGDTT
ncbi:uncharacterized protein LOC134686957 [Mytilus trossulus]|uniref:uncharacterized protein LOC134686957 n=1 Tax=Mytilus trossulus TaxID=6551 RepID=UPI0030060B9B